MKMPKVFNKFKKFLTKDKAKTLTTVNCFGVFVVAGTSFKAGMENSWLS